MANLEIVPARIESPIPISDPEIVPVRIENASSAASTSASPSFLCYDVFINHRGPDVKDTVATDLYRRLLDLGLQVFLDRDELVEGHQISSQIEAAIRVASVQLAIFSPTYAKSEWCLNELVLMVNSGATIIPVFYHVEPSLLRRTTGAYGEGLQSLQQKTTRDLQTGEEKPRYGAAIIQSWRNALSHVAGISGFVLHGDEGELLEKVVQAVLKKVPKTLLDVAKYPTGLAEKLQDFEKTVLSAQQELKTVGAKVAGIVGLGGVGKTTLAKQFFNLNRSHYNTYSFLFEVRENARTVSLSYLQSKLIQELKPSLKHRDMKIESCDQGIGILKKHLSSCHALIVLDDIDSGDQLEAFLPIKDILSPDSLILVTSRDKQVMRSSGLLDSSIYHLRGLSTLDSKGLFCSYAFYQRHPVPQFEVLVDRFVVACGGLPLSLKVFGALVCGQEKSYWEGILDRLNESLPTEIQERLRISYESLDTKDRSIFLDIVCFCIGENIDKATRIWDTVGLKNLENKCLLEVDTEYKIKMHDHIRDMGRVIAKEGSMPRRLSGIDDFLERPSSGITEVRGISMVNAREAYRHLYWEPEAYRHLYWHSEMSWYKRWRHEVFGNRKWKLFNNDRYHGTNLKILAAADGYLHAILRRVWSPHLIWLRWYACPYRSLPSWVPMKNLRVLEVFGSRLKMLWQSETQVPLELRELYIQAPLSHFPKSIRQLKHLEKIVLHSGHLSILPEGFCDLCSLKFLELNSCSRMMSLPESFGKLTNLQQIELLHDVRLESLPESFGKLRSLQRISFSRADRLKSLPESFGNLTSLQRISFSRTYSLESLPESFGNLTSLQHMSFSDANMLKSLPESFGNLTSLQRISFSRAHSLESLPESFGKLRSLQSISFSCADRLKSLPESFGNLISLQSISISRTHSLESLPESLGNLTSLQHMSFSEANMLKSLPDSFGHLTQLKHLDLRLCWNLSMSGRTLGNITTLEYLDLIGCKNVNELLSQVGSQPSLKKLMLDVNGLKEWPSALGKLSNLEELRLGSDLLEVLPPSFLGRLKSLKFLRLLNCPKLKRLPDSFGQLAQLTELWLWWCGIEYLPEDLLNLKNLNRLYVMECPLREVAFKKVERERETLLLKGIGALNKLDSIHYCMFGLKELTLSKVKISEVAFPEGVCPNLQELFLLDCEELRQIGELCGVTNLRRLEIQRCANLEEMASLETLISLAYVCVSTCKKLKSIEGLARLTKGVTIRILGCPKVQWGDGVVRELRQRGAEIDTKWEGRLR